MVGIHVSNDPKKETCITVETDAPETEDKKPKPKLFRVVFPGLQKSLAVAEQNRRALAARQLQARRTLAYMILSITGTLVFLVLVQRHFVDTVEDELRNINKVSGGRLSTYEDTEATPSIILDETIVFDGSDPEVHNRQDVPHALDGDATKPPPAALTKTSTSSIPTTPTKSNLPVAGKANTNTDADERKKKEDILKEESLPTLASLTDQVFENARKHKVVTEEELVVETDDSSLTEHQKRQRLIDYMKLNVIFKIYSYIYAFYLAVTVLLVLQFLVIIKMMMNK